MSQRRRGANRSSNPYRFGPDVIRRWEKRLTVIILVGFGVGAALALSGLGLGGILDGDVAEEDPRWNLVWGLLIAGVAVAGLAVLVPLLIGCLMGGLAIHRFGWIPGLLTFVGILGTAAGLALEDDRLGPFAGWLAPAGIAALVAGVLGFFLVGCLARVPMRGPTGRADLLRKR
ncbi:hypothetical protein [Streptomyces profundus]|uniref:hypothetical protein n=1 Tax=Streptomyces profundus TaxID=2867410 RepID=UPI001D1679BF|nr:hypothetical protein [Streptomyces sp. MA3_2.13]UED87922.1 hypothetical protein K4G22_30095 [Streptomyces sp. MA3_2.13]